MTVLPDVVDRTARQPRATRRPPLPSPPTFDLFDRFVGSDPGFNRLRSALMSVLTIGLTLLAESIFVNLTHALQLRMPPGTSSPAVVAQIGAANHKLLVIALLLGAMVGMMSSFGVFDTTARGQVVSMLFLPFPMLGALAIGIGLGNYRILSLVVLVALMSIGAYLRRFGPRGMVTGMLFFLGDFFGFFLHSAVNLSDLGWLAAMLGVGLAVAMAIRFTVFYPRPAQALARIQRSYAARARKVAALALALFDEPSHSQRQERLLHRHLVRLNEAALMTDAQLGDPRAVADGSSGQRLHQRLFDVELSLTNIARFAVRMTRCELSTDQRLLIRQTLLHVIAGDSEGAKVEAHVLESGLASSGESPLSDDVTAIVIRRFAGSVIELAEAMSEWESLGLADPGMGTPEFQPSVTLFGGWLPGSSQVSATASLEPGRQAGDRTGLAPYTRVAIQVAVAVGGALVLGDVLSPTRYYWAVIAAFITFAGANNSGEQARKAAFRVAGTLVGIAIGSVLVNLVGHSAYGSVGVILVSLFFGFYLMRVNYAFMVIGITVMVSQLYFQLGEFSNSLLLLRLEETAIGAGVAIAVVMLVFPLRTRRVVRVAMRDHVEALENMVEHAAGHLSTASYDPGSTMRADARSVDASYQALVAAVTPLRRTLFGSIDETIAEYVRLATASRHYARNLVLDVEGAGVLDAATCEEVARGCLTLRQSLKVIAGAINGPREGAFTRSSSIFASAEHRLTRIAGAGDNPQLAIRDLMLIDQSMAAMAERMGLRVTDYDTEPDPGARQGD